MSKYIQNSFLQKPFLTRASIVLFLLLIVNQYTSSEQSKPFVSHPSQLDYDSFAEWIEPEENEGVFYFRKRFELTEVPEKFIIHVSGDARYKLFINGTRVCWGPAVGDLENWNYETIDIASRLGEGNNIIASLVWNWGRLNGTRQLTERTAFILQGDSPVEQFVNTNSTWKVFKDPGYHVLEMTDEIAGGGYIAGGTDSLIAAEHPWDWFTADFDDSEWPFAREIGKGNHIGLDTWKGTAWKLKPREIPFMEEIHERIPDVLEIKGIPFAENKSEKMRFEIPPNTRVEILLDNRVLTMGYPQLRVSGGRGSRIQIQYQEALWGEDGRKGNRYHWENMIMKGIYDVFMPDGGERLFEPLWIRVFRYLKLSIETQDYPIVIHDFYNIYTAYPLRENAEFISGDSDLDRIWEVSWRTARLCALESYWDCPYYEQVQYIGDTRIQALITMYVDGDDRLARNAINQFYASMQPMGLTKSAHPTRGVQIIPPFSLLFIGMIHDYYMLGNDPEFVRQFMPGIRFVLEWFINRIDDTGMLGPLPYWNHIDGGTDFVNGSPPGISDGGSAHMSLLLVYALEKAAEILGVFGYEYDAERFIELAGSLKTKTMELCYCPNKQLVAETPAKQQFSQHTNIFAVLTDAFETKEHVRVMQNVLEDRSLIQTTLYFKFYLFQALKKAGMGEKVIDLMDEWKQFLDYGFTTFPEHGINSRSDCHAWSAHPLLAFLNIICGIETASPGFKTVEIRPHPGHYSEAQCTVPHPLGEISVTYRSVEPDRIEWTIQLPDGLDGTFIFDDTVYRLAEGENKFTW
jgi:alpha-L-rhamnosidase